MSRSQQRPLDLAGYGLGQLIPEHHNPGILIRRGMLLDIVLDFFLQFLGTFVNDQYETERMHLFTSEPFEGEMTDCDEGELVWVRIAEMDALPQWEGDRIFHRLLKEKIPFFELELVYSDEKLLCADLNGKRLQN